MIKVTTRYLASHFVPPFLLGCIFFVSFLITYYMFRLINILVSKDVELASTAMLLFNLSVSFLPLAVPLSAFFATIFCLNRFSEDSEIIALRSFGFTRFQSYKPFLIVSLAIAVGVFGLYRTLIPRANVDFKNSIVRLTSSGMLTSIKPGQFFTEIPGATLFTDEVSEDGNSFKNVYIYLKNNGSPSEKIIMAKKGALLKISADKWSVPIVRLNLIDGNIINWEKDKNQIEKLLFKEYDFPVISGQTGSMGADKDSMKTNRELLEIINEKKQQLKNAKAGEEKKSALISLNKTKTEFYSRFLIMFQIVLFIFVGFTLGIKKRRGPVSNNTAFGIMMIIGYYAIYFGALSLSNKGKVSPELANLLPLFILFISGIYFYRKLDWAS